jgi:hypothetical protein
MSHAAEWLTLAGLGAYHGLNPAMGWLFAVSQGLQHGERREVVRSFAPIAIGHEAAVVVVAIVVLGLGALADPGVLHVGSAAVLLAFGIWRFARPRFHPRWTTMRVNRRELTLWSFLMSSAHGAGLMVAPVLLGGAAASASTEGHDLAMAGAAPVGVAAVGVALHLVAMVSVMAVVALAVYAKLGVEVLRKAWVNTDALWAAAFVMAGVITLFT